MSGAISDATASELNEYSSRLTGHMLLANLVLFAKFFTLFFCFLCSLRYVASANPRSDSLWHTLCSRTNGKAEAES